MICAIPLLYEPELDAIEEQLRPREKRGRDGWWIYVRDAFRDALSFGGDPVIVVLRGAEVEHYRATATAGRQLGLSDLATLAAKTLGIA
jgi:hypothetical protein